MMSILALRAVLLAAFAGVQGLAVVADGDRTQVLIDVEGQVTFEHGMLSSPPRIVVDVSGATFRLPQQRYLDINRGGVLALRSSQYQSNVVRVVIDLAEAVDYSVQRAGGMIVVSFPNPAGSFEPWRSDAAPAPARAAAPADRMLGDPVPDPARADRPAQPVAVTQPAPQPQPQQPPIWVEFRNTPIQDVLAAFADFSGRSIVPGQGVAQQTITATIQGQPWDEAMRAILAGQGLTARELPSGIIMVTSLQHQRTVETQEAVITRAFRLQYVAADSVVPQIRDMLTDREGRTGSVTALKATNTIFVQARQSVIDQIEAILPDMDRRSVQVTVRARIVEINRTRARELGFRYEFLDSRDGATRIGTDPRIALPPNISLAGSTIAALGNAAAPPVSAPTFSAVTTLLLNAHALVTFVDAAQSIGLAELQADPTVRVMDNYTARIQVGQRVPIRVTDAGAGTAAAQAQVRMEEVGVILEITPSVVGDQIRLDLHAERSFVEPAPLAGQFVFSTSETRTQITVDDGQTTVISGLTSTDMQRTRTGIPILMNLPLIGFLFRHDSVEETVRDILILVTPHIDRAPEL